MKKTKTTKTTKARKTKAEMVIELLADLPADLAAPLAADLNKRTRADVAQVYMETTGACAGEAKPADKPATEPCGECLPCLVSFADGCANPIEFGGAK